MRCSEQAPRSRHLRQTTALFPPTGTVPHPLRLSLSLGSLGVASRLVGTKAKQATSNFTVTTKNQRL